MPSRCWCPCHQDGKISNCATCGNTGFIQYDDQVVNDVPFTRTKEQKPQFPLIEVPIRLRKRGRG